LLLQRNDERLHFVVSRFLKRSTTYAQLLDLLIELVVTEANWEYNRLFSNVSLNQGKELSRNERKAKGINATSLTYGEIDFHSFVHILLKKVKIPNKKNAVFYDLGSGTGRAVIAARLTQDYLVCEGVELLEGLHEAGSTVVSTYLRERSRKGTYFYSAAERAAEELRRTRRERLVRAGWGQAVVLECPWRARTTA